MSNSFKSKERKSLCEESMLVFVNILKFSSLSLARRTLVTSSDDDENTTNNNNNGDDHHHHDHQVVSRKKGTTKNNHQKAVQYRTAPLVNVSKPQRSSTTTKKRLQKPEQPPESKLSYVTMLPEHHDEFTTVEGKCADYIKRFHEKAANDVQNATVEGKAANYIKRFHEKNMKDLNNESQRRAYYVLPPPPSQLLKS